MSVIRIPTAMYYGYEPGTIMSDLVSLAEDNEYISVHSLCNGDTISVGNRRTFVYKLNIITGGYGTRKLAEFCGQLMLTGAGGWTRISHSTITKKYYGNMGAVVWLDEEDRIHPLMILGVKRRFLFSMDKDNPDPRQFCVVIDRSFTTDEEHFKLFRNINKHYLPVMQAHQVDVLYTSDLVGICFNQQSLVLPKFKTIEEMMLNYQSINVLVEQAIKAEITNE